MGYNASSEDNQHIKRCLKGDASAFALLMDKYKNRVYFYIVKMGISEHDAYDLTQQTFIKVFKILNKFDPKYPFYPWILPRPRNLSMAF